MNLFEAENAETIICSNRINEALEKFLVLLLYLFLRSPPDTDAIISILCKVTNEGRVQVFLTVHF